MAEFVRAQIFGTTFEITSRCDILSLLKRNIKKTNADYSPSDMLISNLLEWAHLALSGEMSPLSEHRNPKSNEYAL
jgi:hypothetical protein